MARSFSHLSDLRSVVSSVAMLMAVALAGPVAAQSTSPGGFLETATSTDVRPRITPTLPSRGSFTFPAPYNTTGIRLTNSSDCGGADCVNYVGYSYWRNTNNHVGSNTMLIFVTLDRARGGGGPTLFSLDKTTDQVTKVGPLFDASSALSWASGEGWYWSPTQPTKLYVVSGAVLSRYDVNTKQLETVFDASTKYPGKTIWQTHTSNDDKVHSATLRDATTYAMLGCLVYNENTAQYSYFAKTGDFDECQIDKSGQWLLIKEQLDGVNDVDNVIVNLATGQKTLFYDPQGAAGHSDNGYGYMVAEDNWYPLPGAVRVWTFGQPFPSSEPGTPPQGQLVYRTTDWSANSGHISHADAQPGVALDQQYACASNANRLSLPRTNEIICFRLDASLQVLVVAPVMTSLDAAGGGDDYSKLPKGNLDLTGQYFIWTSNVGGNRLDAFVVKVPSQLLVTQSGGGTGGGGGGSTGDTTPPTVSITDPIGGAVSGAVTLAANASDNVGVAGVQFKINGVNLGAELTTAPYSVAWDSGASPDGTYTVTAVARDAAGNTATSAGISVVVSNTAPTVSISAPTGGATLSGTVTVSATASDTLGVAGVQFKLNGVSLGAEVTTAPYSMTWDTSTSTNGGYTLTATARDTAGNVTTSSAVAVTVSNSTGGAGGSGTTTSSLPDVVWTSLVNTAATGNSLTKSGGCNGCQDAGAVSLAKVSSGSVSLEFTASETTTLRYVGLTTVNSNTSASQIMFAFALQPGGLAEIRELGRYRGDTAFVPGDVLKITVKSRVVRYYKNGTLIYTSKQMPRYPMRVDSALLTAQSTINNAHFGPLP